jgi:hypothetical protein
MPDNRLKDFVISFVEAAETCRDKRLANPTLVLIYTSIDILGSLLQSEAKKDFELKKSETGSKEVFGTRHSFCFWVDRYIDPKNNLDIECGSSELYGARCGLLHELRLESNMSNNYGAKIITYAWGTASVEELRSSIAITKSDYIAVHIDTLIEVWKNGIKLFLKDEEMIKIANEKAKDFVANLSVEIMGEFLKNENGN